MTNILKHFFHGFRSGLRSISNAFNSNEKPFIEYRNLDTRDEIRKSFQEVGDSMRWAMDQVDKDPDYKRAVENHAHYDARQSYLEDEQRRKELGHPG